LFLYQLHQRVIQSYNALKVRFSATLGDEEVEVAIV
jgi:hypothetical protein